MKIGLTQRVLFHNFQAYDCTEHGWYQFLKGHTLVFIPNHQDQDFSEIARDIDLLVITGGDNDPTRVAVESILIAEMQCHNKPIIGVCHGCFILTEHLGGECDSIENHHNTSHYVQYRDTAILVNSFHTHCVRHLPPDAVNLCTSEDEICEAWIKGNIAGITWHPERMEHPWIPNEIARLFDC